jgi:hypothetical protein
MQDDRVIAPVDLTSELVDQLLESARLEMEHKLAQAGPLAVTTLHDVMTDTDAKHADRISAAKEVIAQVRGRAGTQETEKVHQGPTINITINKLSTGERYAMPIPVSDEVMDLIEAHASDG